VLPSTVTERTASVPDAWVREDPAGTEDAAAPREPVKEDRDAENPDPEDWGDEDWDDEDRDDKDWDDKALEER
jgi:hypothetical protein